MIRLKDLLDEGMIMQGSAFTFTQARLFPLIGKIADAIWSKEKVRGFHFTSPRNIEGLRSMRGKQKALSISTYVSTENMRDIRGPVSRGMGVWLEGDVVFKSWQDLGSRPDEQGRRWVNLNILDGKLADKYRDTIRGNKELTDLIYKVVDLEKEVFAFKPTGDKDVYKRLERELGVAKGKYVKAYLDVSLNWATKNLHFLQMYARDVNRQGRESAMYNDEYIVTNIKLIDVIMFDQPVADKNPHQPGMEEFYKVRKREFDELVKTIKSSISGKLVLAPSLADDGSGNVQKKFFKDRMR